MKDSTAVLSFSRETFRIVVLGRLADDYAKQACAFRIVVVASCGATIYEIGSTVLLRFFGTHGKI